MLLYKNGRIYNIPSFYGETRYECMRRAWFQVNSLASEAESLAWSAKQNKECSYGSYDETLLEKEKNLTK